MPIQRLVWDLLPDSLSINFMCKARYPRIVHVVCQPPWLRSIMVLLKTTCRYCLSMQKSQLNLFYIYDYTYSFCEDSCPPLQPSVLNQHLCPP